MACGILKQQEPKFRKAQKVQSLLGACSFWKQLKRGWGKDSLKEKSECKIMFLREEFIYHGTLWSRFEENPIHSANHESCQMSTVCKRQKERSCDPCNSCWHSLWSATILKATLDDRHWKMHSLWKFVKPIEESVSEDFQGRNQNHGQQGQEQTTFT